MAYIKPEYIVDVMIQAGERKAQSSILHLTVKGAAAAVLLGFGVTLASMAKGEPQLGLAILFIIVACLSLLFILKLELVTGSFAFLPMAVMEKKAVYKGMLARWGWVIFGHLTGGILYALAYAGWAAHFNEAAAHSMASAAEAKTTAYAELGAPGVFVVLMKAIVCNFLVTLGIVFIMLSRSKGGKVISTGFLMIIFFSRSFEHAVVNMYAIPAGMLLGADVSVADWWLWNELPVLTGNLLGGLLFAACALSLVQAKEVSSQLLQTVQTNLPKAGIQRR